ncbi:hypothetical protein J6590_106208 [Homalodisca vitripennis]|nr:hypothetical protein J6590_106208 [Homalodisca vitripennis]
MVGVKMGYRYLETNLEEMGQQLHLPSLAARRALLDLMFLYRLLNSLIDCPNILQMINFHVPRQSRHPQLFSMNFHPTNYTYYSTLPRIMRLGNDACADLDFFGPSTESFKRCALAFILNVWSPQHSLVNPVQSIEPDSGSALTLYPLPLVNRVLIVQPDASSTLYGYYILITRDSVQRVHHDPLSTVYK